MSIVVHLIISAKFLSDAQCYLSPFPPIDTICTHAPASGNAYKVIRLINFWGSSFALQPSPLHRLLGSIHQMTSFRTRMCLLGSQTKILHFDLYSPQNGNFRPIFHARKFRLKGLNMTKHLLFEKLRLSKLDVEIDPN